MDDAQTWRRVFSKMTSLQHESDDDALSFERLSNWQDTCISTRESEADRSQRTRRDSQFQNTHLYTRREKQTELVAVATKDRTINPDLERGMPRAHMATRSKSWGAATRFTPRDPRRLQLSSKTLQRTRDEIV
jgi:hypothetical protein